MKKIFLDKNIKEQFEKEGLAYPRQKTTGKYGLKNSTLLDRNTLEESEKATLKYLEERRIIECV